MVNFYVPNYTKEEFEELDNKVLLLSKEKSEVKQKGFRGLYG